MKRQHNLRACTFIIILSIFCGLELYTLGRLMLNSETAPQFAAFAPPAVPTRPVIGSPIVSTSLPADSEAGRSVYNPDPATVISLPATQGNSNLVTNTAQPMTNTPVASARVAVNTNTPTHRSSVSGSPSDLTINLPPGVPVPVRPAPNDSNIPTTTKLSVKVFGPKNHPLDVTFYGRPRQTAAEPDFTVVVIPDPQFYARSYPEILNAQMEWILNNRGSSNILYVVNLGDNVVDPPSVMEWQNAEAAWNILDSAAVPYGMATGNHDGAPSYTENFNKYFGVTRFEGRPYYGGHYGSDNDNHFDLFTGGGLKFIVIYIEYDNDMTAINHPVVQWANDLLQTYRNRRAIVVSHSVLQRDTSNLFTPQGQTIYNALKGNSNLFLMMGGHWDVAARRTDTFNGNTVYTLRSDYQDVDNAQSGYLRIMRFSPAKNMIYVSTYSPNRNKFYDKPDAGQNIFNLPYPMEGAAFEVIGTAKHVAPGGTASVTWKNLDAKEQYQWFVTASDGTHQASSDIWKFTTVEVNIAPIANEQVVSASEDTPLPITLTATDANGDIPSYSILNGPSHGALTGTAPNLTYTPQADYNGIDSFTFQASDGKASSSIATVNITIDPVNDAPLCTEVHLQVQSNVAGQVDLACTDKDGDALSYFIVDLPGHGTVSVVGGRLEYISQTGYSGVDSFTYKSNDGAADSNRAIVNVTVLPASESPATDSQSVTTSKGTIPGGH